MIPPKRVRNAAGVFLLLLINPLSSQQCTTAGHSTPPPKVLFNNVQAAAMALGLSPEQLELMTSPPKHTRETEDRTGANKHVTIYSPTHG